MPEQSNPKIRPRIEIHTPPSKSGVAYAELHTTSNFSFLHGASHPEELVARAYEVGCHAVGISDINTLAGIVRGYATAKEFGMPYIVGCHLQIKVATGMLAYGAPESEPLLSVLVYPTTRAAYGRLCQMLTFGKRRAEKGQCKLTLQDLFDHQKDMVAILVAPERPADGFAEVTSQIREVFDEDRLSLAIWKLYDATDDARNKTLIELAKRYSIPLVATNDVHYHVAERQALQDVLTCIRLGCTLSQAGLTLFPNAERHIKGPEEMARLFRDMPKAIGRTIAIAERAKGFSLDQIKYEYPHEICPQGKDMMQHLMDLTLQGAEERYAHIGGVPESVRQRLTHEFDLIRKLNYAAYFLTVHDMVVFARTRGILCQGRGAAANSAVCYCLGVTAVDPSRINLLVERFISVERNEPPDIDIDFEHERREEVIQYLYSKYGRERAALTAEVISYRRRSAVRDVGKALGLSLDCVDRLAKAGDWWDNGVIDTKRIHAIGMSPDDKTLQELVRLVSELIGFPRHLSQHVGGFVLTNTPLCEIVPIENAAMDDRTVIEWDKDDIDTMGMLKVDVLALGMLTAIRKAMDLVNNFPAPQSNHLQLHTIPPDDPPVYDMLCKADSIGVFQVESRAQMTMLPRLKPRCYYDLVIEVSIVRPGPIVGNMVHPYLRRRNGTEPITYPSEAIKSVLERTLGVPLFQEQVMRIVMVAAGFTPGEADQLRRAMAAWKRKGHIMERFGKKIIEGMSANGYSPVFAHRLLEQIKGFGEYGFPESHAASFALLVYVSAWLKHYHPAAFAAALVNSQPMGFYQPAQLIRDAKDHGVEIRSIDVNHSTWDCTLEVGSQSKPAVRLGMRLVKGLRQTEADFMATAIRRHGHIPTIEKLWRLSTVRVSTLRALAEADAFASMGLTRQTALWAIQRLHDEHLPMFDGVEVAEQEVVLPDIPEQRLVVYDYAATGLSLKAHPIFFVRNRLHQLRVTPNIDLANEAKCKKGQIVTVAGLVLVRQRPGTASGIIFMTIEDETGVANLVIFPQVYERFRQALRHSVNIIARGKLEREGLVIHVNVAWADDLRHVMKTETVSSQSRDFR